QAYSSPDRMAPSVENLLARAPRATTDVRARAVAAARALEPLNLAAEWQLVAAAVPLLEAQAIAEKAARDELGAEYFRLARHAATLPDPRLAAREAMSTDDP